MSKISTKKGDNSQKEKLPKLTLPSKALSEQDNQIEEVLELEKDESQKHEKDTPPNPGFFIRSFSLKSNKPTTPSTPRSHVLLAESQHKLKESQQILEQKDNEREQDNMLMTESIRRTETLFHESEYENAQLTEKVNQLGKNIRQYRKKLQSETSENTKLTEQIEQLKETRRQQNDTIDELEDQQSANKEEIETLKEKIRTSRRNTKATRRVEELEFELYEQNSRHQMELKTIGQSYQKETDALQAKLALSKDEAEQKDREMAEKDTEIAYLRQQLQLQQGSSGPSNSSTSSSSPASSPEDSSRNGIENAERKFRNRTPSLKGSALQRDTIKPGFHRQESRASNSSSSSNGLGGLS